MTSCATGYITPLHCTSQLASIAPRVKLRLTILMGFGGYHFYFFYFFTSTLRVQSQHSKMHIVVNVYAGVKAISVSLPPLGLLYPHFLVRFILGYGFKSVTDCGRVFRLLHARFTSCQKTIGRSHSTDTISAQCSCVPGYWSSAFKSSQG